MVTSARGDARSRVGGAGCCAGYSERVSEETPVPNRIAGDGGLRDYRSEDLVRAGGARGIGTSLRMTARLRTIGAVTLGRVSGMGGEIERLDRSDDPLSYDITYVLRGGFDYLDGGSWRPLEGVVKMGPTGVPNRMRLSGRSAFVFARIEKSRLLRSVVELPETFRVYRRMTLADHALAGMIASVLGEEIEPAEWERALVERSVVEFAGGVFRGRLGQQADARSPHDALRDRVKSRGVV